MHPIYHTQGSQPLKISSCYFAQLTLKLWKNLESFSPSACKSKCIMESKEHWQETLYYPGAEQCYFWLWRKTCLPWSSQTPGRPQSDDLIVSSLISLLPQLSEKAISKFFGCVLWVLPHQLPTYTWFHTEDPWKSYKFQIRAMNWRNVGGTMTKSNHCYDVLMGDISSWGIRQKRPFHITILFPSSKPSLTCSLL